MPFCTGHSEAVDGLVAVAQLWQCAVSFAEVAEGCRRSELRSTVGWSIRHRVKCSPRETGRAEGLRPGEGGGGREVEEDVRGRGTAVLCHLRLHL